ncbi:MAG: peptidylprolyl isomerase [Bacteroidia bacterium]|nr:peptidylprolyl isomerase [Bacteroidia bacterium]
MKKAIISSLFVSLFLVSGSAIAQTKPAKAAATPVKPARAASTPAKPSKPASPAVTVQQDPILMTIAGEQINRSEFDRVFRKNNRDSVFTEASVREYLDLYINYKLKVKEAETMQMDTSENFKSELAGYKKQLAQPYLTDKEVSESLIREAYERLGKDVKASHILLKVAQDALPRDTVQAYNRILKIRDMILKGADFGKVARDSSEDPSAKDNNGDLGYFTGMQMVYPFESTAFTTKPGTISMPVRTRFGYHIIKVHDIRQAQGEIHAAHIMIRTPKEANDSALKAADARIREVEQQLKNGLPWDTAVARYSEDKGSAKKGGELPWFGTGRMVPEFEKAAFALKNNGDLSGIVKTSYGYHIIRLLERRGIPPFEEKKAELKQMIARDSRNEASKQSMIARIKKKYKYTEIPKVKEELINALDSSLSEGEWDLNQAEKFEKTIFTLTDTLGVVSKFTQQDFAKYISTHQTKRSGNNPQAIGYSMFEQWTGESCLSYLEERLDLIYPDFKNLMREYRDGILLFDLTDKMVWSKAVKDTAGLQEYYQANKNNYLWGERCDAVIYTCSNSKAAADFRKAINKGKKPASEIISAINKTTPNGISTREGRYAHGENELIEAAGWKKGLSADINKNNQVVIVDIKNILPVMPKTLDEAKGVITADYQTHLEKTWIESLRAKYAVQVNEPVLQTMWTK